MPNLSFVPHPVEAMLLARVPALVRDRAAGIRLMVFDVDGVLTDGSLWYGENGETVKRFHVLDGQGLRLLGSGGIAVALMTARESPMVTRRAADLGINEVHIGVADKAAALTELVQKFGVTLEQTGYMGDDVNDLPALRQAGLAVTVPGAPAYIAQAAHWVTESAGGAGAVRECCDLILAAQGRLGAVVNTGVRVAPASGSLQ